MRSTARLSLSVFAAFAVAAGTLSGPALAKSGSNKNKTTFWLMSTAADPDATAKAIFELKNSGDSLRVELRDLPAGLYDLSVGGVVRAAIELKNDNSGNGESKGEVRFDSKKGLPLTFDPVGQTMTIVQGTTTYFSDTFPTTPGPIPDAELKLDLVNSGVIPGASGTAETKIRNGRTDFSVEIEDVPAGDYILKVDGVTVGTITAAQKPGRNSIQGDLEYSTDVSQIGHLPLTFDPAGATIEVFQGTTLILSLNFPLTF